MKNITLSADDKLIEAAVARRIGKEHHTRRRVPNMA